MGNSLFAIEGGELVVIDEEIVVLLFGKKALAIWGTGRMSYNFTNRNQWILRSNVFYIDNNCEENTALFWGKEVKKPDKIKKLNDLFIIVASIYYKEIKRQLISYGLKENIDFIAQDKFVEFLFKKLLVCSRKEEVKQLFYSKRWTQNLEDLYKKIDCNKIKSIVFQLKDVLLLGNIENVYRILGKKVGIENFDILRKWAKNIALSKNNRVGMSIDIDEIYSIITKSFDISDEVSEKLKKEEGLIVEKVLQQRKCMKDVYDYALHKGKKICLVSNYPYSRESIEKLLRKNGYVGYDELYLEKDYSNIDELTCCLLQDNQTGVLYVGSEGISDIEKAAHEWQIFYMPSPTVAMSIVAKLSEYLTYHNSSVNNSLLYDVVINKIFDNPFVNYDIESVFNGQWQNMSLILFVPIILEFALWMYQEAEKEKIKQMIWVYRDGYLFEEIFKIIGQHHHCNFEMKKIYLSRAIRYCGAAISERGLLETMEQLPVNRLMTVEKFVSHRLLVNDENEKQKILSYLFEKTGKKETDFVADMVQIMEEYQSLDKYYCDNAKSKLKTVADYCWSVLGNGVKTAVFDIGYRGSVVDFLHEKIGIDTMGFHLFKKTNVEQHTFGYQNTRGFVLYGGNTVEQLVILNALYEDIISIQEGTAKEIEETGGEYKVIKEVQPQNNKFIDNVQKMILEFANQFISMYEEYLHLLEFDPYHDFNMISNFLKYPYINDANLFKNLKFIDSIFLQGTSKNNFYDNWFEKKVGIIGEKKDEEEYN